MKPPKPLAIAALALCLRAAGELGAQQVTVLRYAHMNSPDSIAGQQASLFAKLASEYSRGGLRVEVLPSSQTGSLDDQLSQLASGLVAIHHATAAGFGSLHEDFSVLDTPFMFRDVDHMLRVVSPDSPTMARLGEGLLRAKGIRVLYTFYFGTRHLTCDRPVLKPADLAGVPIRSIPFPMYSLAVEAMGAVPTPIDWSATPTALAAKAVRGQENPVNTILSARLYESQSHVMLTGHIIGAEIVGINEATWQRLGKPLRDALARAAAEASAFATQRTREQEEADLAALRARGMKVLGPDDGLQVEAFAAAARALVAARYGARWADYYLAIASLDRNPGAPARRPRRRARGRASLKGPRGRTCRATRGAID